VRKTKFKKLLLVGLGNLVSGMFFGVGYILVEHADNTWWNVESDRSKDEEIAEAAPGEKVMGLVAIEPCESSPTHSIRASRRFVK
jgi:hypothetical protein